MYLIHNVFLFPKYRWLNSSVWLGGCLFIRRARTNINTLEWNVTFHYVAWVIGMCFPENGTHVSYLWVSRPIKFSEKEERLKFYAVWWCDGVIYQGIHTKFTCGFPSNTSTRHLVVCGLAQYIFHSLIGWIL